VINYRNLEPITLGGTATDVVVNLTPADDSATLASSGGQITVTSNNGTFETTTFPAPTASLTVNGLGGVDDVTLAAMDLAVSGSIAISAETIAVNGGNLQAASIGLIAGAVVSNTPPSVPLPLDASPSATASITVGGGAQITTTGNLILNASSNITSTLTSRSLAIGAIDTDAAAARNNVASVASVHISGATLNVGGTLSVQAGNIVNVSTTANGAAGGATAIGASGALSTVNATTTALVDGATSINAGAIQIASSSNTQVATVAIAAQQGALNNAITPTVAQQLLGTYRPGTASGPVTLAAAVAVSDVTSTTTAGLASTSPVVSAAGVSIVSQPLTNSSARGDARTVNGVTGVGAAVGLNLVSADGTASLGGGLQAPSLVIQALTPAGNTNAFGAEAYSGAGTTGVGVAGALALNAVTSNQDKAALVPGANAALGGTMTLQATNSSQNTATASGLGLGWLGIGASVAMNVADNRSRAAVESGATVSGVTALTLDAQGSPTTTTTAFSGAAGGTATAGAVSLAVPSGATEAAIESGPALSLGTLSAQSTRTSNVTTRGGRRVGRSWRGRGRERRPDHRR
jgi:hypothetical protein